MPRAAVAVEDRYGNLLKHAYAPAGFLPDMLARVQVRYPEVPIVFLETRPLAEEWPFRYLGAALDEYESEQDAGPRLRAAELPLEYEPDRGTTLEAATEDGRLTATPFGDVVACTRTDVVPAATATEPSQTANQVCALSELCALGSSGD
jgi:hypothetical protein